MSDKVRLIDANITKKAIELLCEDERTNMTAITYFVLLELLDTMPTKDVVLCTECKYAHLTTDGDCKYCDKWEDEFDCGTELYLPKDFYCAFGERKPPERENNAKWEDNKCSACGKGIENLIDSREWYENEKPNYCPFCGTRFIMEG